MLLTEDQAKEKLCMSGGNVIEPMLAHQRRENLDTTAERIEARKEPLPLPKCKASDCMFWRWHFDQDNAHEINKEKSIAEGFQIIGVRGGALGAVYIMRRRTAFGYCGLAGNPVPIAE